MDSRLSTSYLISFQRKGKRVGSTVTKRSSREEEVKPRGKPGTRGFSRTGPFKAIHPRATVSLLFWMQQAWVFKPTLVGTARRCGNYSLVSLFILRCCLRPGRSFVGTISRELLRSLPGMLARLCPHTAQLSDLIGVC